MTTLTDFRTEASPTTTITVEDQAGLDALPVGTKLLDCDGDTLTMRADRGADWSGGSWSLGDPHDYLPATVLNPEILGDFYSPNPFRVGDRVAKATVEHYFAQGDEDCNYDEDEAKKGDAGIIDRVDAYRGGAQVHVKWDHGRCGSWISPDNLVFEPKALFRAGDPVEVDYIAGSSWNGPAVVTKDFYRGDEFVIAYSFGYGAAGGFRPKYVSKHDPDEFIYDTGRDEAVEEFLALPEGSVAVREGDSLRVIYVPQS